MQTCSIPCVAFEGVCEVMGVEEGSWLEVKKYVHGLKPAPGNWSLEFSSKTAGKRFKYVKIWLPRRISPYSDKSRMNPHNIRSGMQTCRCQVKNGHIKTTNQKCTHAETRLECTHSVTKWKICTWRWRWRVKNAHTQKQVGSIYSDVRYAWTRYGYQLKMQKQ